MMKLEMRALSKIKSRNLFADEMHVFTSDILFLFYFIHFIKLGRSRTYYILLTLFYRGKQFSLSLTLQPG